MVRLPDGSAVERELAQIIMVLRCNGVQVDDHGARGWGSPIAYLILRNSVQDLDMAAWVMGHQIDPRTRDVVMTALRSRETPMPQSQGRWWPSGSSGWAIGAVAEIDGPRAAVAWPSHLTLTVERNALADGPRARLRLLTARQRLRRHPWVLPRRVLEKAALTEDYPPTTYRGPSSRELRRRASAFAEQKSLVDAHRRSDR